MADSVYFFLDSHFSNQQNLTGYFKHIIMLCLKYCTYKFFDSIFNTFPFSYKPNSYTDYLDYEFSNLSLGSTIEVNSNFHTKPNHTNNLRANALDMVFATCFCKKTEIEQQTPTSVWYCCKLFMYIISVCM